MHWQNHGLSHLDAVDESSCSANRHRPLAKDNSNKSKAPSKLSLNQQAELGSLVMGPEGSTAELVLHKVCAYVCASACTRARVCFCMHRRTYPTQILRKNMCRDIIYSGGVVASHFGSILFQPRNPIYMHTYISCVLAMKDHIPMLQFTLTPPPAAARGKGHHRGRPTAFQVILEPRVLSQGLGAGCLAAWVQAVSISQVVGALCFACQ